MPTRSASRRAPGHDGENSLDGYALELVRRLDVRVVTAPGRRPYRAKGRFLYQRRDLETETNAELFVLQPVELKTGDERDAVAAWGERTRRPGARPTRRTGRPKLPTGGPQTAPFSDRPEHTSDS